MAQVLTHSYKVYTCKSGQQQKLCVTCAGRWETVQFVPMWYANMHRLAAAGGVSVTPCCGELTERPPAGPQKTATTTLILGTGGRLNPNAHVVTGAGVQPVEASVEISPAAATVAGVARCAECLSQAVHIIKTVFSLILAPPNAG